jgi:hypothetical protein
MPIVFSTQCVFPPSAPSNLVILTTNPLPQATVEQAYSTQFSASGGVPPYTWQLLNWSQYTASIFPTSLSAEGSGSTVVSPSCTVTATGGAAPYVYAWQSTGNPNITVNSPNAATTTFTATNLVSGTPVNFTGTCIVTDSLGRSQTLTIPVTFESVTINWNPGDYMLSNQFLNNPSGWEPEVTALGSAPSTFVGYAIYCYWTDFETSPGTYSFTNLDNLRTALRTALPGGQPAHLMLQLNLGIFNGGAPTPVQGSGVLPAYITQTSTYGAAIIPSGSGVTVDGTYPYGYYVTEAGFWVNFTNSNVMGRIQSLLQALGNHLDSDPYFEGIIMCAWDVASPYPGTGITDAQYFGTQPASGNSAGRELILQYAKQYFPNCNVIEQTGWSIPSGNETNPQLHAQWCVQNAILLSCSDTMGTAGFGAGDFPLASLCSGNGQWSSAPTGTSGTLANSQHFNGQSGIYQMAFNTGQTVTATFNNGSGNVTWTPTVTGSPSVSGTTIQYAPMNLDEGVNAWMGLAYGTSSWTPVALQTYGSFFAEIQSGDISNDSQVWTEYFTPQSIATACNATGSSGYKASHRLWTYLTSANTSVTYAWWTNLAPAVASIPVTNTSYPSVY